MSAVKQRFLYNWSAQRKVTSGNAILKGKVTVSFESQRQTCYHTKRENKATISKEEKRSSRKGKGRTGWDLGVEKLSVVSKMWLYNNVLK